MDIKAKIEEIVNKAKNDKNFAASFQKDPVKAIEGLIGIDLPDDVVNKIIDGVKAKVTADTAKDAIGGIINKFKS